MKFIIYVVLGFLPFISWSQEKITDWKFLYKITTEEGIALSTNSPFDPQPHHYHELIDSSKNGRFYDLSPGFYLKVFAIGESLQTQLINQTSISARVINSQKGIMIQVVDSTETIIEDAVVTLNGKPLTFDPTTKTFTKRKWDKEKADVSVKANGEALVFDLKKNDSYRKQKRKKGNFWRKLNPLPLVNRMRRKVWSCIKGKRPSDYYQGYMVLNKPKYRPGDTVKVKGYFINKKKKNLTQDLELRLYNKRKDVLHQQVVSKGKGVYVTEFVLEDSFELKLDRNHTLFFYDKYKKREYWVRKHSFRYEDYQLDEVKYDFKLKKSSYFYGDTVRFLANGFYKNGLRVKDAQVKIQILVPENTANYAQASSFYTDKVVIENDTLWTYIQTLDTQGPTEIIVPDSVWPAANFRYQIISTFTNTNGEIQTKKTSIQLNKNWKQKEVSCFSVSIENLDLVVQNNCIDRPDLDQVIMQTHKNKNLIEREKINLPYRKKIDGGGIGGSSLSRIPSW